MTADCERGETRTARQVRSVVPETQFEKRKKDRTLPYYSSTSQRPWVWLEIEMN